MPWSRKEIASRVAREFSPGHVVSLGVGLPLLVVGAVDASMEIVLHSESGILGLGTKPAHGKAPREVVSADGQSTGVTPGGAFFDISQSTVMARGGHIDICVLGGLEVDERGNLANWTVPGEFVHGVGAAMDLAVGSERVIVVMSHVGPDGEPKLVTKCSLPLTAVESVDTVVTELGVFEVDGGCFRCVELAPDTDWEDVEAATEGRLIRSEHLGEPVADPQKNAPSEYEEEEGELVAESDWEGD